MTKSSGVPLHPAQVSNPASRKAAAQLRDASKQFEAMFVEELLKPLTKSMAGESDSSAGGGHVYRSMATDALGEALASGQSFGIAEILFRQLASAAGVTGVSYSEAGQPVDSTSIDHRTETSG